MKRSLIETGELHGRLRPPYFAYNALSHGRSTRSTCPYGLPVSIRSFETVTRRRPCPVSISQSSDPEYHSRKCSNSLGSFRYAVPVRNYGDPVRSGNASHPIDDASLRISRKINSVVSAVEQRAANSNYGPSRVINHSTTPPSTSVDESASKYPGSDDGEAATRFAGTEKEKRKCTLDCNYACG